MKIKEKSIKWSIKFFRVPKDACEGMSKGMGGMLKVLEEFQTFGGDEYGSSSNLLFNTTCREVQQGLLTLKKVRTRGKHNS